MIGHLLALRAGQESTDATIVTYFLTEILKGCMESSGKKKTFWDGAIPYPADVSEDAFRKRMAYLVHKCLQDDKRLLMAEAVHHPGETTLRVYISWL